MEVATLTAVYEADTRKFEQASDKVERELRKQERAAERAAREIAQTYNRAGGALQNLLGRVPGGGRLAQITSLKDDIDDLGAASKVAGSGVAGLGGAVAALGGPAVIAAVALAGLLAATVAVSVAVFNLAAATSEAGSQIYDLSAQTGLTAETLSGLKVAADQSGTSIETVAQGFGRFTRLVGEAERGSKQATATLRAFGVDAKTAAQSADAALEKVLQRILELPPGMARAEAAQRAFGRGGAELVPMIEATGGSLEELKQRARDLGVYFDTEAARQSDEFGDALDDLTKAAQGAGYQLGRSTLPTITRAMRDLTASTKEGGSAFQTFGDGLAGTIEIARSAPLFFIQLAQGIGVATAATNAYNAALQNVIAARMPAEDITAGASGVGGVSGSAGLRLGGYRPPKLGGALLGGGGGGGGRGGGSSEKSGEEKAQEALSKLNREIEVLGDNSRRASVETQILEGNFKGATAATLERLKATASLRDVTEASNEGWKRFTEYAQGVTDALADGVTPTQEFERSLAKLYESIVGTDSFIDAQKQAAINQARWNAQMREFREEQEKITSLFRGRLDPFDGARAPGEFGERMPRIDTFDPDPRPLQRFLDRVEDLRQRVRDLAQDFEYGVGGAIERVLVGDFKGAAQGMIAAFRDAINRMVADFLSSQLRSIFLKLAGSIVGGLFGGIGGGLLPVAPSGIDSAVGSLISGSRAFGGPVSAGKLYETHGISSGRELFIPKVPGHIYNQAQIGQMMGGQPVINDNRQINIMVPMRTADSFVQKRSRRQAAEDIVSLLR